MNKSRIKNFNAYTKDGNMCRLITADSVTMNVSEWIKYLQCSVSTFYTHLNRGEPDFTNFVRRRKEYLEYCKKHAIDPKTVFYMTDIIAEQKSLLTLR